MSHRNSLLLVDPEFDPGTAADCTLLLKVTADSFSYAIIDKNNDQLKAVYDQQESANVSKDLAAKIKNDPYLSLPYKEIKVSVYTGNSISIPNVFFDPEQLNQYAKYFSDPSSDHLYARPSASYGFTSIFTLQEHLDELLNTTLNSCVLFDHAAPILAITQTHENKLLTMDFTATSFNAAVTEGQQLIFRNYYEIENAEEFNYYLLLMINQLQIDCNHTSVLLSGIVHEEDERFRCIRKYFSTISFHQAGTKNLDQRILDEMPAHYYSSLLALDLCE